MPLISYGVHKAFTVAASPEVALLLRALLLPCGKGLLWLVGQTGGTGNSGNTGLTGIPARQLIRHKLRCSILHMLLAGSLVAAGQLMLMTPFACPWKSILCQL